LEIHIIQNCWEQEKQQKPKQKKSDIKFREQQVTHERELAVTKTHLLAIQETGEK
jgi:catechol-2,3-dioxygenase